MHPLIHDLTTQNKAIGVVGLGYVGLPLACLMAKKYKVLAFDINSRRIRELRDGVDRTGEVSERAAVLNPNLFYSDDSQDLKTCSVIIVAVPTPVDSFKKPDLRPLISASETIGKQMNAGCIVVYESTVYPGLTEDVCRKTLEKASGLTFGKDFQLGYSPERVNPGDKEHGIESIVKVVSASSPEALDVVDYIYSSVITAGTHRAASIATAEAAKVIENTQRDLNIALINELASIFEKIGLDTQEVLAAAKTKWNFLGFQPGLVGGHCIGVDPYYLTYLADSLDVQTQVISAGRKINDGMSKFVAQKIMKMVLSRGENRSGKIAICGMTFKENVPDLRNSKVLDLIKNLEEFGASVYCLDPLCDPEEFHEEFGRNLSSWQDIPLCDAVVIAVPHADYLQALSLEEIAGKLQGPKVFVDLKGKYNGEQARSMGLNFWRL